MDDMTNKQKAFKTNIGLDATVQRSNESGEQYVRANRELMEIGAKLNPLPKGQLKHLGSAAFHLYYNETLGQMFMVDQTGATLNDVNEQLAQTATKNFIGSIMESYGQRRPKFRSGF